jgi:uncharacterized protein (TIGR02001 family)
MRKFILPFAFAAASASVSAPATAQQAAAATPPPPPVTGNITLASEYRFRGIDQTFGKPALQGGFDYSHASGIYLGNWNSNVSQGAGYPGGNIEMDFYGGYKHAFGDFGVDVGAIYYAYPGTDPKIDNKEVYLGGSWKFLSVKWFYSLGDYFKAKGSNGEETKGTNYLDLALNYDLGSGWGVNAHWGHLNFKHVSDGSYNDWKLGVTKDLSGWVFGAAYIGTDAKGDCSTPQVYCFADTSGNRHRDSGRDTIVLSVGKTF